MNKTIGHELSPILTEIEATLWNFDADNPGERPDFTEEGFRASIKIFMSTFMERLWLEQERLGTPQKKREEAAKYFGAEVRKIIKQATGIDSHDLYK